MTEDERELRAFEAKIDRNGPLHPYDPTLPVCWVWTGGRYFGGYGSHKHQYAHCTAWAWANGRWPQKHILHSCDRPWCVNPAHLREGTNAENARDRVERRAVRWRADVLEYPSDREAS